MAKRVFAASVCGMVLVGCTTTPDAPALPEAAEVQAYVAEHWNDFGGRFGRLVGRPGEAFRLTAVKAVSCSRLLINFAECSFDVTANARTGEDLTLKMYGQFERGEDGRLAETLVMFHERRR